MEYFVALALFAFASSATPGPNNVMVMTSGLNFGVRPSIPLLLGICIGFSLMIVVVGLGFSHLFTVFPRLHLLIKIIGTGYLLYLAYLITKTPSTTTKETSDKPLTFINGALFQWVNAKAWVVATGAIAVYSSSDAELINQTIIIALVFLVVSLPSVGLWLVAGSILSHWLKHENKRKAFNYVMAFLLVLSVFPVISELMAIMLAT